MRTAIWCCGNSSSGELGIRGVEEDHVNSLTPLNHFIHSEDVCDIVCGLNHTVVLLKNGTVYTCGNNDCGQLGRSNSQRRFEQVETLAVHIIKKIFCGSGFSMALNEAGQLFAWGSNCYGQLGLACDDETVVSPKIIKSLALKQVIQVACGCNHALALTHDGEVYSWGRNHHYQLGSGTDKSENQPQLIKALHGLPISQIAAGGNHSFALTVSGALFGWGKNAFGQLGISDTSEKKLPSLQRTLKSQYVTFVSCGENHSAVLTQSGGVFTFGAGMYGQLGHGSKGNELLPRKISELMGNVVTQISCGRCHTVAYVPSKRRIYAFGLGGSGQLGLGSTIQVNAYPSVVPGPWNTPVSPTINPVQSNPDYKVNETISVISSDCDMDISSEVKGNNNGGQPLNGCGLETPMEIDEDNEKIHTEDYGSNLKAESKLAVRKVTCGGDHTFVLAYHIDPSFENADQAVDFRVMPCDSMILTMDSDIIQVVADIPSTECVPQDLMGYIETVLSSPACLNASALTSGASHYNCNMDNHGVDMSSVCEFFHYIKAAKNSSITDLVADCLRSNLLPNLGQILSYEGLRLYMYLPMCHLFRDAEHYTEDIIYPYARAVYDLEVDLAACIAKWWSKMEPLYFKELVEVFKNAVLVIIDSLVDKWPESFAPRQQLRACLNILKILKNINTIFDELLPYQDFYMPEITDLVDVQRDYVGWLQSAPVQEQAGKLFLCDYPFLFDAKAKTLILQADSLIQMQTAMDSALRQNLTSAFIPLLPLAQPFFVLYVTRENIVLDTIQQLARQEFKDLKKPLKVIFCGEDAVDAGGVKKEFFLLLTKAMLDPKYGMFKEYPETRCIWFQTQTFEEAGMFGLIGIVCGLAIYNSIIIDLPFPLALYKKLLKEETKLEDVKGLSPSIAKSLRELLDYENDDVEDVFMLYFEITQEIFGDPVSFELKPGGKEVPVTKENKAEYVDLYVDFLLNKSIQAAFEPFADGFHKVCSSRILELFHAQELMALVIGNESYEWEKLQKSAEYKNGYHKDHAAIKMFWRVFHSLDESDKKKFLLFLTGSDRIPILGMESIKIIVQPMNVSDDHLPVAHTCFNVLDLPHYSSEDILRKKLKNAIQNTQGFGLA